MTKIVKKSHKQKATSSDADDIPLMELAKRIKENDRTDKLGNDDTSAEDQKSINEVVFLINTQRSHRLRLYCKLF